MSALNGSVKSEYLGSECPQWPCEMNQDCQMFCQMGAEAGILYQRAAGGAVSYPDFCVFG